MELLFLFKHFKLERISSTSKRLVRSWMVWIMLIMPIGTNLAQEVDTELLFEQGLQFYRHQRYEVAKELMRTMIAQENHSQTTKSLLLLVKIYEKLGDYNRAQETSDYLISHYPESRYTDYARILLAAMAYSRNLFGEAMEHCLYVINSNREARLVETAEAIASEIVDIGISPNIIQSLARINNSERAKNRVVLWLARAHYGLGQKQEADTLLAELIQSEAEEQIKNIGVQLMETPIEEMLYPIKMGVVLPLSGYFKEAGKDFLRGMLYALKQSNVKVRLVIRDSKTNLIEGLLAINTIINSDVTLIIGDLEGQKTIAMSALAAQNEVPYIVPVATDNGISRIGPNILQMNSDLERRGTALAKYAFEELNMHTFAMLAPADEYGQALTDAFANTVDKMGGTIIAQQWYYPGAQDFKRQFLAIREAAFNFSPIDSAARQMALDSLQASMSDEELEEFEVPITCIDGFFFPVYEEDLAIVAPQYALANIHATPLGSDYWLNADALRNQRSYINGIIFCAGLFIDEADPEFITFRNEYRRVTSASPDVMDIYGYDIMRQLILSLQQGNLEGREILSYLQQMSVFEGLGGNYYFENGERVNRSVNILQFLDGNIYKLTDYYE